MNKNNIGLHRLWHRIIPLLKPHEQVSNCEASAIMQDVCTKEPDVLCVNCDDDLHMSSEIYFVPHETKDEFMGYSMLIVPQCDIKCTTMFLYPGHIYELKEAIDKMIETLEKHE